MYTYLQVNRLLVSALKSRILLLMLEPMKTKDHLGILITDSELSLTCNPKVLGVHFISMDFHMTSCNKSQRFQGQHPTIGGTVRSFRPANCCQLIYYNFSKVLLSTHTLISCYGWGVRSSRLWPTSQLLHLSAVHSFRWGLYTNPWMTMWVQLKR